MVVAKLVRANPGSEVAVKREGERKGREGYINIVVSLSILNKRTNLTNNPQGVSGISLIAPARLRNSMPISQPFCNSLYNCLRI
jgi:hypothetical protein